jgi:hypothetical protein
MITGISVHDRVDWVFTITGMRRHFWLDDDEQWAIIEPFLPQVHTGPERVDDRRIISGQCRRSTAPTLRYSTAITAGASAACGKGSPWALLINRFQRDPVAFARQVLGKPDAWQAQTLTALPISTSCA